jgi:hypothetical protein
MMHFLTQFFFTSIFTPPTPVRFPMKLGFKVVGDLLLTAGHMEVGLAAAGRPSGG